MNGTEQHKIPIVRRLSGLMAAALTVGAVCAYSPSVFATGQNSTTSSNTTPMCRK